jgi:hypothetical protein
MVPRERARRRVRGAVWDGDGTSAPHQRARRGRLPPSGEDCQLSIGVPQTVDDRDEAVSGPATRVAKLRIPEYRARHEGRLRERLAVNPLLWVVVGTIAVMIWMYRHRRPREDDLGSVSARWLQEYRNETHESH